MCSIALTVTHHRAAVTLLFCFHTGNCTPPSAHHFTSALREKQSAEWRSLHRPTRGRDSRGELMQISFKHNVTQEPHSHVLSSVSFYSLWGCLFAFKNISGSHKCLWSPEQNGIQVSWLSAVGRGRPTAQRVSQEGKQADRVGLVEGKKRLCYAREWVWPGGRHCYTQLLICPASQHKWPLVNHLPADRFSHDIPRAQASHKPSTDAGCRNRHNSGKVNCLKVKQAGELMPRPDEVLKVCHRLMQVYFLWRPL